ncbi:hypothetical protein [uncultured Agrobacterium sp.]|nr:hypothetical protein [uncultured Agrobacterium sp.]
MTTPFSAVGELFWYHEGLDIFDFIKGYLSDYATDAEDCILAGA